jgi:hypothetical protein
MREKFMGTEEFLRLREDQLF